MQPWNAVLELDKTSFYFSKSERHTLQNNRVYQASRTPSELPLFEFKHHLKGRDKKKSNRLSEIAQSIIYFLMISMSAGRK